MPTEIPLNLGATLKNQEQEKPTTSSGNKFADFCY
jgi:hypothetical protein